MQDFFSFINYICCKYIFFSPKWRKQHNVLRYIFLYTLFLLCYSSVVDLTFDTAHVDSFLNVHVTTVTPACTPLHTKVNHIRTHVNVMGMGHGAIVIPGCARSSSPSSRLRRDPNLQWRYSGWH